MTEEISDESKLVLAIKEVGREISLRRNVYRRWVEQNRMTQTDADLRIRNMEFAYEILLGQRDLREKAKQMLKEDG